MAIGFVFSELKYAAGNIFLKIYIFTTERMKLDSEL